MTVACSNGSDTANHPPGTELSAPSPNESETPSTTTPSVTTSPTEVPDKKAYALPESNIAYRITSGDHPTTEFLNNTDGQAFQEVALHFTDAYLTGNHEEMRRYLIDPEHEFNTFASKTEHSKVESVNMKIGSDSFRENEVIASMELTYADRDTFTYLTLEMQQTEKEWMIRFYGLEG